MLNFSSACGARNECRPHFRDEQIREEREQVLWSCTIGVDIPPGGASFALGACVDGEARGGQPMLYSAHCSGTIGTGTAIAGLLVENFIGRLDQESLSIDRNSAQNTVTNFFPVSGAGERMAVSTWNGSILSIDNESDGYDDRQPIVAGCRFINASGTTASLVYIGASISIHAYKASTQFFVPAR